MDHRTRLLHDVEKAESTSDVIDDMHQNVRQGIELGKSAANNLAQQRTVMQRALDRVRACVADRCCNVARLRCSLLYLLGKQH